MKTPGPIPEKDLEEQFVRASGPGGQNVNKVATKVILRHIPTNITVTAQEARSQAANRQLARQRLAAVLDAQVEREKQQKQDAHEKQRRRTRPRPMGLKRRLVESKRHRASIKKFRSKADLE